MSLAIRRFNVGKFVEALYQLSDDSKHPPGLFLGELVYFVTFCHIIAIPPTLG
jgi:hypothetical protein